MSTASILLSQLRQKAGARLGLELPQSLLRPSVDFARWLPYTHPIMQTRGREVEERELELEIGPEPEAGTQEGTGASEAATTVAAAAAGGPAPPPPAKQPCHSFLQLRMPLSRSAHLQGLYVQSGPHGPTHNIPLWLEDMDTFAADVGGRHCDVQAGDKQQVTAFLESLVWFDNNCLDNASHSVGLLDSAGGRGAQACGSAASAGDTWPAGAAPGPRGVAGAKSLLQPHDMRLSGQVTWVGKSSMEVTLELWAHPAPPTPHPYNGDGPTADDGAGTHVPTSANSSGNAATAAAEDARGTCSSAAGALSEPHAVAVARFLMAARSRDLTSAALVPPLQLSGELDRARFDQGIRDNQARQDRRAQEKAKHPPDASELALLTQLMGSHRSSVRPLHPLHHQQQQQRQPGTPMGVAAPPSDNHAGAAGALSGESYSNICPAGASPTLPSVPMASTRLHHVATTTDKDVNTSGSTFGGHLLRLGYEHAVRVAEAHSRGRPCHLLSMSEVAFLALVPIGAELHLDGLVAFVEGDVLRVRVTAYMLGKQTQAAHNGHAPHHPQKTVAQTFWCAFQACSAGAAMVGGDRAPGIELVAPHTAAEVDLFLHALRQHKRDMQ